MAVLRPLLLLLLALAAILAGARSTAPRKPSPIIRAAYYPSYRNLNPSSIRFSYFTHIFYAFVEPDPVTHALDISTSIAENLTALAVAVRTHRPAAKILISIGGGGSNHSIFAALASTPASRAAFINSSIAAARLFGIDGLDLDWEFPADAKQMSDLGCLFREWRRAVEEESARCGRPPLLLTAAVYFAAGFFLGGQEHRDYPIVDMAESLDWINAMCFDYHAAAWEPSATGLHAALYSPPASNVSTSHGIRSWVEAGIPREKVVMGIPVYGWTWSLKDLNQTGVGAPAVGVGPGQEGYLTYSEIVDFDRRNKGKEVYDEEFGGSYSYAGAAWVGYDGRESVTAKSEFGKKMKLGGYFFWALGYDDESWTLAKEAWERWRH